MRKCRLSTCRQELPKVKDSDWSQSKGFCNIDHMAAHGYAKALQAQERRRKAQEREARAEHRDNKLKVKKRTAWVADAQRLLNQIVVIEDKPKGCITCNEGKPVTDSGHYFHRGNKYRVSPLTLLRSNLAGQCSDCNRWEGGKQHEWREGFIARYGQEEFDKLVEYKRLVDCGEIKPLTIDECKERIAEYKEKLKYLRDQPERHSDGCMIIVPARLNE